jgi:hypothetical protein
MIIIVIFVIYLIYIQLAQTKIEESFSDYHTQLSNFTIDNKLSDITSITDFLKKETPKIKEYALNLNNSYNPSGQPSSCAAKPTPTPTSKPTPNNPNSYCPSKPYPPKPYPPNPGPPKPGPPKPDPPKPDPPKPVQPSCATIECPTCPTCPICPICPAVPDMSDFYHQSEIEKCKGTQDLSKYILKTEIPKCQQPDLDKYILKTKIPKYNQPDMSKYVLKSSISPDKLPNCKCPTPKLCPSKSKSFCTTSSCDSDGLIPNINGSCNENCITQEDDTYQNYNDIITKTGLDNMTDIFNN